MTTSLRLALPALFLPLALLAGCDGGSGGPDEPSAGETATDPTASDTPEPSASTGSASDAAPLVNPCDAVDQDKIAALMGLKHVEGNAVGNEASGTMVCSFFDTDHLNAPLLSLQTSATDEYDQFLDLSKSGAEDPQPVDIPGADEAALLVDEDQDFPGVTVVAHSPGRLFVAVVGDKTVKAARELGIDAITLLVASSS